MPIYEYQCGKCGNITEVWQKFSDPPIEDCKKCGGPVKKIISQNTFHLKGSGWYVTDYAAKPAGSQPSKNNKAEKTKETKETKKETTKDVAKKPPEAKS
jgi:putative FmdB family regulatory protein